MTFGLEPPNGLASWYEVSIISAHWVSAVKKLCWEKVLVDVSQHKLASTFDNFFSQK